MRSTNVYVAASSLSGDLNQITLLRHGNSGHWPIGMAKTFISFESTELRKTQLSLIVTLFPIKTANETSIVSTMPKSTYESESGKKIVLKSFQLTRQRCTAETLF